MFSTKLEILKKQKGLNDDEVKTYLNLNFERLYKKNVGGEQCEENQLRELI